jgi:hypothetical protein
MAATRKAPLRRIYAIIANIHGGAIFMPAGALT